jgi:sugar transferase (PEP-CTERM/EpsH1 system associated)
LLREMNTQVQEEAAEIVKPASRDSAEKRLGRLRVLHVIPRLGLGGTEKGVLKVMRGLGENGFTHKICAVRGIDAEFAKQESLESKAYSADSSRDGFQFPLFRLKTIMEEFRPHIVHSRNFGALEAVPAARLAHIPVVIHSEHGYELEILRGLPMRRRVLCRFFYGMADAVFTVTDDLRRYHAAQSWLPPSRFQVLYNGVDTEKFTPHPLSAVQVRTELGIPAGRFLIGSVGRLVAIKDHKTLLRAAETLLFHGLDVHILLVGAGPEMGNLQNYVASSSSLAGRVMFVGASDRVPELLNAMDAFVLPSICEGMSNTILEAMACGVPVIVTSTGGNPELIEEGRSGYLFPPGNAERLSALLSRLAENSGARDEFRTAGRRRAVEQFSLAGMMQHYQEIYTELASRNGVREGT